MNFLAPNGNFITTIPVVTDGTIIDVIKYPDDTPALNTECIVIEAFDNLKELLKS